MDRASGFGEPFFSSKEKKASGKKRTCEKIGNEKNP